MMSIIWQSIFVFLAAELVVTVLLCVPFPLKVTAWFARVGPSGGFGRFFHDKLERPILYIGIGLAMALGESLRTHRHIMERIEEERNGVQSSPSYFDYFYPGMNNKERKYKSERNIYLSGFALTLLFVIGRIASLLKESVELHEEAERLEKSLSPKEGTKKKN